MNKSKNLNYWYLTIAFVLIMLTFGYIFELGEAFGKALAN